MAKNKKPQSAPKLSPENYIRQKARNLEIHECLINNDWKESGTANIIVARIHTNGNLTVGGYLVDLMCLGVMETNYSFNSYIESYKDMKNSMQEDLHVVNIPYNLAHNIIYSALSYAEGLGFSPTKDFINITQYILEEDTDEIELVEIECGRDGQPMYVTSEDDSAAEQKRIIAQLEKAVGKDNFSVVYETNEKL